MPPLTPLLTVDVIIRVGSRDRVVLIRRRNPPPGWALPGGFVDYGESLEAAAVREAREETSLEISDLRLVGCYSDPARDPRFHTISAVFAAIGHGIPHAADDALHLAVFSPGTLPAPLCFDHAKILEDYNRLKKDGRI